MVICTYYLNNNCRFGAKCNNDHIDLASVIKSEVDVTLKGNQWPLSCFGPFKERNSVPNFIEDLSFEEVRTMYLEAKMQNNVAGHQMQLAQMIADAKQKMQWITSTNRDVMNVLIEIYNQPEDSSKAAGGNPFATVPMGTTSSVAANIFGGGSSGGFGGAPAPSTTGTLGGNIFAKVVQPAPVTNIFSSLGQPQPQQQTGSVFGGPPSFGSSGGSLFAQASQPSAPIFGAVAPVSANPTNPFAQQPTGFSQAPAPTQNIFASVAPTPFVAPPAPSNPFGGGFTAQQPTPFGQPIQQQPQPSSSNLFLPVPTQAAPSPFGAIPTSLAPVAAVPAVVAAAPSNQFANLYSRMEDLTAEQLDAFKAERFELGKIPTVPPPKELCS